MHLVSSEGVAGAAQQALFMPMLTRMPKARVKMLVVSLSPNAVPGAVLRQNGVPVYDVALSKQRFAFGAFGQLLKAIRAFKPDVIQAWGHTAQIVSYWLKGRCEGDVKLVWSIANTAPLSRKPGVIDRQKLKYAAQLSKRADRIIYSSEACASAHRRVGFPEEGYVVVPFGVDPTRFKPDLAARRKIREQLGLGPESFVIGMVAPFQPEYDHSTLLKAVGELIKTEPNVSVLLAGHGVQKGNAPLMALVGGGTLGTRTQLLGEWSDVASFFNACDLACSSALTDNGRMSLVSAMLCGIPCVATGMGAQGEVIGQFGVAIEPGSPVALIRGITRVMQMSPEKRAFMAQGARKHALTNFVSIRSLQKYLQLYYDLVGRSLTAATSVPAPEIDAAIPAPKPEAKPVAPTAKPKTDRSVDMQELRDPDSLESRDSATTEVPAIKPNEGDVLQMFESKLATQAATTVSPMAERARGVAEDLEDLLAPEVLNGNAHAAATVDSLNAPLATPVADAAKPVASTTPEAPFVLTEANPDLEATVPVFAVEPSLPSTSPAIETKRAEPSTAAEMELSLADTTITVSMKISLDATGTLEIPPELIFTSVATKPSTPVVAQTPKASVAAAQPPAAAPEEKPALVLQEEGKALSSVSDSQAATAPTADSSTVPALAVDALLSQAQSAGLDDAAAALQLDLLGDPPAPIKAIAGS